MLRFRHRLIIAGLFGLTAVTTLPGANAQDTEAVQPLENEGQDEGQEQPQIDPNKAPLKLSMLMPLSGPFAFVSSYQLAAIKDYGEWINSVGGIRGHALDVSVEDTAAQLDRSMSAFKRRLAVDNPFGVFGDSTTFVRVSAAENRERHKRFMVSTSYASDLVDTGVYPYHFMAGPNYTDAFRILLKYIKDTHDGGTPRIAILHSSTEFGRDPIQFGQDYARELGIDVVGLFEMKMRELDVTIDVIKLREAKPDYTIVHGFGGAPIIIELMKRARDYQIPTKFMGTFWGTSRVLMRSAGPVGDGFIGLSNYAFETTGSDQPMLQVIDKIQRAKNPNYDGFPTIFYMQGWMSMMMFTKAAELAIDAEVPLTGDNLARLMRELKDWDTGGVVGAPVTFRDQRIPVGRIVRFDGANMMYPEPLSDWLIAPENQ